MQHYCPASCGLCDARRSVETERGDETERDDGPHRRRRQADTDYDFFGPGELKYPPSCEKEKCEYYASYHRPQGESAVVFELGGTNLAYVRDKRVWFVLWDLCRACPSLRIASSWHQQRLDWPWI